MVLTITVVGGNGGGQATPTASTSNSQELHTVLSPNDLAQLMSGQTVTGLLNPDGSITLNSHLVPAQQQQQQQQQPHIHQHHQQQLQQQHMEPASSIPNTSMNQHVSMSSPSSLGTTTTISSSGGPFQYCRNVKFEPTTKFEPNVTPTNSLGNMQAISTSDLSSNNHNINNSVLMNNLSHSHQQQSQPPAQQVKKTGQKRLTAKQKLALQQQQQQQQQQQHHHHQTQQHQTQDQNQQPALQQQLQQEQTTTTTSSNTTTMLTATQLQESTIQSNPTTPNYRPTGSPGDEDGLSPFINHEHLQSEFQEVYANIHSERLNSMSKNQLVDKYLLLEERVEELENRLRECHDAADHSSDQQK